MKEKRDRQVIFNAVYEENVSLLNRIATRISGSAEAGEDICQEALFRYYERIGTVPEGEEARYWLIRVVKNLSLNYGKRKERERQAYRRLGREPRREQFNEGEEKILREESGREIRDALAKLPPKYRVVLILKEYEKMSYKEIGESLKLSESNVKVRVFRAREQLSRILKKGDLHVPR
ncbi:MAG: sigma-70 family RNA polymerase sigma factor [Spirochaetales bacterium]|nr:sigma-70 family RNA polymerase sigma factor [Spirochaetales bacterium]